jgi:hypothetical protein
LLHCFVLSLEAKVGPGSDACSFCHIVLAGWEQELDGDANNFIVFSVTIANYPSHKILVVDKVQLTMFDED